MKKIVYLVFLLSLLATVTNRVQLSVAFVVLALPFPLLFARLFGRTLPRFYFILLVLYAFFVLSALLYAPRQLLDPSFYRRDGNFFPVYFPILILGLVPLNLDLPSLLRSFVLWASLACLVAYFTFAQEAPHLYDLAFLTHNAAGGFLSIVLAFCVGLYLADRNPIFLLIALVDLFMLIETGSRGSLIALLLALVQVILLRERFTRLIVPAAAVAVLALLVFTYPRWIAAGQPVDLPSYNLDVTLRRSDNITARVLYLWPRAWDDFLRSPILGQGFGSFNDVPYRFQDFGIASLNTGGNLVNSDAYAHNSFLNLLAETGLVGLSLFILYLAALRRFIGRAGLAPAAAWGFRLAFWVVVWSSFTEDKLTAPAQMLPFTILLGFALSDYLARRVPAALPAAEAGASQTALAPVPPS